jgi:hypothetical protein
VPQHSHVAAAATLHKNAPCAKILRFSTTSSGSARCRANTRSRPAILLHARFRCGRAFDMEATFDMEANRSHDVPVLLVHFIRSQLVPALCAHSIIPKHVSKACEQPCQPVLHAHFFSEAETRLAVVLAHVTCHDAIVRYISWMRLAEKRWPKSALYAA